MARLMLSAGMFSALAAATAVRSRGFFSGSPPLFAAMVISLIRRVKIFPRLASSAPFLCLIVAHFEWPDMRDLVRWMNTTPARRLALGTAHLRLCSFHPSQKRTWMGHPFEWAPARRCRAKQDYSIR